MKKALAIFVAVLAFGIAANAQPKAAGLRLGLANVEASYQHYLGSPNFAELTGGLINLHGTTGFSLTGTYNFVVYQPEWTDRGEWSIYAGAGLTFGAAPMKNENGEWKSKAMYGAVAQAGLEYSFWFPLQVSADLRPVFGYADNGFWNDGLSYGFIPTISVRYKF